MSDRSTSPSAPNTNTGSTFNPVLGASAVNAHGLIPGSHRRGRSATRIRAPSNREHRQTLHRGEIRSLKSARKRLMVNTMRLLNQYRPSNMFLRMHDRRTANRRKAGSASSSSQARRTSKKKHNVAEADNEERTTDGTKVSAATDGEPSANNKPNELHQVLAKAATDQKGSDITMDSDVIKKATSSSYADIITIEDDDNIKSSETHASDNAAQKHHRTETSLQSTVDTHTGKKRAIFDVDAKITVSSTKKSTVSASSDIITIEQDTKDSAESSASSNAEQSTLNRPKKSPKPLIKGFKGNKTPTLNIDSDSTKKTMPGSSGKVITIEDDDNIKCSEPPVSDNAAQKHHRTETSLQSTVDTHTGKKRAIFDVDAKITVSSTKKSTVSASSDIMTIGQDTSDSAESSASNNASPSASDRPKKSPKSLLKGFKGNKTPTLNIDSDSTKKTMPGSSGEVITIDDDCAITSSQSFASDNSAKKHQRTETSPLSTMDTHKGKKREIFDVDAKITVSSTKKSTVPASSDIMIIGQDTSDSAESSALNNASPSASDRPKKSPKSLLKGRQGKDSTLNVETPADNYAAKKVTSAPSADIIPANEDTIAVQKHHLSDNQSKISPEQSIIDTLTSKSHPISDVDTVITAPSSEKATHSASTNTVTIDQNKNTNDSIISSASNDIEPSTGSKPNKSHQLLAKVTTSRKGSTSNVDATIESYVTNKATSGLSSDMIPIEEDTIAGIKSSALDSAKKSSQSPVNSSTGKKPSAERRRRVKELISQWTVATDTRRVATRSATIKEANNEPVIIDLSDDDGDETPSTSSANSPEDKQLSEKILEFIAEGYPITTILRRDFNKLEEGEFLNDTIIEFYLRYLHEQTRKDNRTLSDEMYIFNAFFYRRLMQKTNGDRYENVRRWLSKVDLFTKKYALMPICEKSHWYLAILMDLDQCLLDKDQPKDMKSSENGPKIVFFDSLGVKRSAPGRNLTNYLESLAKDKYPDKVFKKPTIVNATVPRQTNAFDCGVYILHFAERFLSSPAAAQAALLQRKCGEFWDTSTVSQKRNNIKNVINTLKKLKQPVSL